ncbi:BA75_01878T0 [Komagataella pastoris]|uniref:D-arabinitol 2-dehydrogenase [ribulose-forming] n=1 Tax=Komagataella pastoris TaxID=4922 RepID=A0A1B2JAI9_PICPA|nr:BA75_01878T0 [Komagataella pastoris]
MSLSLDNIVPSFRLDGSVSIVTGGSGGLASVITKALLAQGSEIAVVDINLERTKEAAELLIEWGKENIAKANGGSVPRVTYWACNVADAANVEEVFTNVNKEHGKLAEYLVHCAGYCENFPAHEYPARNAESLVQVNLLGSLYVSQSFARPLIKSGHRNGSIVLVGSMSGTIVNDPQPQVAYNMSKAGVIHLARSLACEWAPYNIRVNTLSPGYILTPLTRNVISGHTEMKDSWESKVPMKRLAEPNEFVGSVLYLLSKTGSSYTTGHNLVVDGGYECW